MNAPATIAAPQNAVEVIDLLERSKLLAELGITASHARTIKARNSIPATRDAAIVAVARLNNLPIDFELLARLRAAKGAPVGEAS